MIKCVDNITVGSLWKFDPYDKSLLIIESWCSQWPLIVVTDVNVNDPVWEPMITFRGIGEGSSWFGFSPLDFVIHFSPLEPFKISTDVSVHL